MDALYSGKSILVTGADRPLAQVLVRELIRSVFLDVGRLYLLVGEQTTDVGKTLDAASAARATLKAYANNATFEALYEGHDLDWFVDFLALKAEVIQGMPSADTALGMTQEHCSRVQANVDLIFHGDGIVDPCDVRRDPGGLIRSGTSVAGFAARCKPSTVLVLSGSLFATAAARRFRSAPLEFMPRVVEEPATGMRESDGSDEGMPSRLVAAQGQVESSLSNLAAQGATARLAVVRHGVVGPPLRSPSHHVMYGGLDALAFGICVGATSRMRVPKTSLVEVVPADILAQRMLAAPLYLAAENRVFVMHAATTEAQPLVLGMVGQYLTEYYGRNRKALAVGLDYNPPSADIDRIRVPLSPVLAEKPELAFGNYCMRVPFLRPKTQLSLHPHAAASARYRETAETAVAMVKVLEKGVARQNIFSSVRLNVPGGTDVREIEWELYCKTAARLAFLHLSRILGVDSVQTPPALKYCEMDKLTAHPGMSFSAPLSLIQRLVPNIHFLMSCVQQPDGRSLQYTPGLTPSRRAVIMNIPSVARAIDEQSKKENVDREAIVARAHAILDRVGDRLNVNMVRMLGIGLRNVMQTIYEHVHTNSGAYEMVRRAYLGIGSLRPVGKRAVILIPSHRSYMDFLVVSYLMYMWGMPVPHICAGEDFLRLSFISNMLRGSGAFFMRRSFKGDQLYASLFREYSRLLATDGRVIEFFIEGSRSRMGKTLSPKVGILKIMMESLLEAVQTGDKEFVDVVFVPVSLSYDKILEGGLYTRELTGEKKPPETLSNLFSAASVLKNKFGTLNVTVGKPISLAEYIIKGEHGEATPAPVLAKPVALIKDRPGGSPDTSDYEKELHEKVSAMGSGGARKLLNSLAWRITANLQSGIIITPTALLAATLLYLHTPTELQQGLHMDEVINEMVWLREQVLISHGHMKPDTTRLSGEQLFSYGAAHLRDFVTVSTLSQISIPSNDSLLLLSIYANQLVHLFCDRALLVSVCLSTKQAAVNLEHLSARCETVKELMSLEFPNYRLSPIAHDEWMKGVLADLTRGGVAEVRGDAVSINESAFSAFICNIVYALFESYWFVAAGLEYIARESVVREGLFFERLGNSVDLLLKEDLISFHTTVNREIMKNALSKMKELKYIKNGGQGLVLGAKLEDPGALFEVITDINALRWKPSKHLTRDVSRVVSAMEKAKL